MYRGILLAGSSELVYFKRVTPRGEDYRIFMARQRNGHWSVTGPLTIGQEGVSDLYPTVSPDGQRLVFTSYRSFSSSAPFPPNAYLWIAERIGPGWGNPQPLTTLNAAGVYHPGPTFLPDGSLRFRRIVAAPRSRRAFVAAPAPGGFAPPVDAGEPAHWLGERGGVLYGGATALSPDGMLAIVGGSVLDPVTGRPGQNNGYVSRRVNGEWTAPEPLGGGVNTTADENFFTFSSDGCAVIYTRDYTELMWISTASATVRP
jgi:hypothetical protein